MPGPLPSVPTNFLVQSGNGQVYLSWSQVVSASSYDIYRSTDNITYASVANQAGNTYYDTTAIVGTLYYYEIRSVNANGNSGFTSPLAITVVDYGKVSLGQIRLSSQQRADMVNNSFITTQEWNSYINHSYTELYDMLVQTYGQEYYAASTAFMTDSRQPALYNLPSNLYKLMGVDLGISPANNAYVSLRNFPFISRNEYLYGNTPTTYLGINNLRYRMLGNQIEFVPVPTANQQVKLWYVPRPNVLLADSDILDGISGWDEYVVVDSAIKAMQKEESDVSVLMAQKMALRQRIEAAGNNRDIGQSEGVSDVRSLDGSFYDGPFGGY